MFNHVKLKYVCLFASKLEKDNIYKIYKVCFDSGIIFYYLTKNEEYQFDFFNDIQMYNYIGINGFVYENK